MPPNKPWLVVALCISILEYFLYLKHVTINKHYYKNVLKNSLLSRQFPAVSCSAPGLPVELMRVPLTGTPCTEAQRKEII